MSLYKESAQFVTGYNTSKSLQNKIFELHGKKRLKSNPKQVFALVINTLKYKKYIEEIIKKSKILKDEKILKPDICLLMVYDLCFTKSGRIQSGKNPLKDIVLKHKTRLNAELIKLKLRHKVSNVNELLDESQLDEDQSPVRWFRVNTIKTTREALLKEFKHLQQVTNIEDLKIGTIYHDEYIPNLFGIHSKEKLVTTDAYLKGRLIIQDRASCFPAHILNPIPGVDKVIDSCAAPGNKTTHLAAILQNTPKSIIAFEKDLKRSKVLKTMSDKAGASKCIGIQQGDFTATNPEDYADITGFVVDPSCSGSGIFGRATLDNASPEEEEKKQLMDSNRLIKLASFQYTIVKHALAFPNARKLVYSTCSINPEENERVVIDLLRNEQVQNAGWRLSKRDQVIPDWPRRGIKEEFEDFENGDELADSLVRAAPKVDGGIGFFAACFERDVEGSSNQADEIGEEEAEEEEEEEEEGEEEWTGFEE